MNHRGFWDKLDKPIMALAPMADVTDAAFRFIIAKYGKPPVMYTEFVSADGLCSPGRDRLLVDFKYSENEHPIVAQIFGAMPENFYKSAQLIKELGFDGIDINMGCPVKKVLNQQSCSALIKTPTLAKEIVQATKEGAGDLPVSVKTRIGFYKNEIETWIPQILETEPAALIVHLRTVKEMSLVPAHWELMPKIMEIVKSYTAAQRVSSDVNRNAPLRRTTYTPPFVLGNGDVKNLAEAEQRVKETGCDGVMLGRAIFGNPWLFKKYEPSIEEKMRVMIKHTYLFEKYFMNIPARGGSAFGGKSFDIMKKHYKAYVNGFNGAKEIRMGLMENAKTAADVERIILNHFPGIKELQS